MISRFSKIRYRQFPVLPPYISQNTTQHYKEELCQGAEMIQNVASSLTRRMAIKQKGIRFNSSIPKPKPTPTPTQHVLMIRALDRLVTSIASELSHLQANRVLKQGTTTQSISPLVMRRLPAPWFSSNPPESSTSPYDESQFVLMSREEMEAMLKPRKMSESFTTFELPLASDPALLERYLNASGGIRESPLSSHQD